MITSLTKLTGPLSAKTVRHLLNWYPPNIGAGIRVRHVKSDFTYAKVEMPLKWYNINYVGSHFGGSLYSMTDPWYMLLLLNVLGSEYIVWDKGATINYVKPGKSTMEAEFRLDDDLIASLRRMDPEEKRIFDLPVNVIDSEGDVVAEIVKTLYVKRKNIPSNHQSTAEISHQ